MHTLPYILKRTDDLNKRHYFKYGEADQFYMSVTTWQKKVLPTSPGLLKWMKNMTPAEQEQILLETSHLGTFLHELSKEYTDRDRSFDLQHIDKYVQQYFEREPDLQLKDIQGWGKRAGNWLYSLNAFFTERNVEPLMYYNEVLGSEQPMTEVALAYDFGTDWADQVKQTTLDGILGLYAKGPRFPFAGAIDLVCELDFNGTRKTAIIDYKTGSIWPSHPYQLESYKLLVESNFDIEIDLLLNWSDKDWDKAKEPTSKYVNQTDKVTPQEMAGLYILAEQRCQPKPGIHVEYEDIIKGEGAWRMIGASEYYQQKTEEK